MSFPSYLASDMEEDNQAPKQAIFSFLFGKNRSQRPLFHKLRFQFIRSMGWKTRVSQEECEEVGGLRDSGERTGLEREGIMGDQSCDVGTRKNWGLDKGREGSHLERHHLPRGLFVVPDPGFSPRALGVDARSRLHSQEYGGLRSLA